MSTRTYYDPLHQGITLDDSNRNEAMVMDLIDSYPFQRLRRIRQLGPASLTFHGAESSRFTHSLGVFHIARRAINNLVKIDPSLKKYRGLLYASALLHDIGHGPLSHTSEEMFGLKHEVWTARLIRENSQINKVLDSYEKGLSLQISDLIEKGKSPNRVIKRLISSQLDCDRLDYLLRDSYSTGTSYGRLDLERILSVFVLSPDGDLAIHPKGLMAIEHYLIVRNLMYRSVYNHRLNEVCNWLLEQIIREARQAGPDTVWADKYMAQWLWHQDKIDIEVFLANDDYRTNYHLLRWKEEGPYSLSELCNRFINRILFKAIDIKHLSNESQLEALTLARQLTEKNGLDPNISCGIRQQRLHGYEPYKSGLRLWDGDQLTALEEASPLIKGLTIPADSSWLIHPKEIHQELTKELILFQRKN